MRILSVVTLVTPTGEYGGPVRVAVNQAVALAERGHDVVLVGGERGWHHQPGGVPGELDGVPARLFPVSSTIPGAGFASLASPRLWRWVRRHARDFDVVHVHLARDLVTLPVALLATLAHVPYVLQTHGMVDRSDRRLAHALDALATRRVLRSAAQVLYLTELERAELAAVARRDLPLQELPNGVPWAEAAPRAGARVLFLARLAPRKRPGMFVQAAERLWRRHADSEFVLHGPDEGEGNGVRAAVEQLAAQGCRIAWEGALPPEATLEVMSGADAYVLPSVDEPYPMSVLEAMSVGLPVVVTDTCGLAPAVRAHRAGVVVDDSLEQLVEAVDTLLADPDAARARGDRGQAFVRGDLSMASVAARLETLYLGATRGDA